jgi:hypothetical protein
VKETPEAIQDQIHTFQQSVLDDWYLSEHKLLTPARQTDLQRAWRGGGGSLDLQTVYDLAFLANEKREYSYAFFIEDVADFALREDGAMSLEEACRFLDEMG